MRPWIVFVFWTVAVPILAVAGCGESSSRSVEGSGHVVTEQRPLAAFQQVELEGEGHLIIGPDEPAALEVRTDDNLMALVDTKVVDGKLVIGIKPNRNPAANRRRDLPGGLRPGLRALRLSGSGEIEVNSCTASDLTVGLDGSGSVRVDGVDATRVDAEIGGSGTIRVAGTSTRVGVNGGWTRFHRPTGRSHDPRLGTDRRVGDGHLRAPASVDPALSSIVGIPPSRRTSAVRAL